MKTNYTTLTLAILGAAKLTLESFGIELISYENLNVIANGIATVLTFVGVYMNHKN